MVKTSIMKEVLVSMDWFVYDKDLRHERVKPLPNFEKSSIVDA